MAGVYGMLGGPSYRAANRNEQVARAFDMPLNPIATAAGALAQGFEESFGIGQVYRGLVTPQAAIDRRGRGEQPGAFERRAERNAAARITEDQYKASPYYRSAIPFDTGMTEDRAASLAYQYDRNRLREYWSQKRPITAFIGSLVGQAFDPINYVPVFGPAIRAASIARMGQIGGRIALASSEAAINTAAFGLATAESRARYGDDVSFEATITEIAMSALIGAAFGTAGGAFANYRAGALAKTRDLETMQRTQEARIALNDAVTGLVEDGEVRMGENGASAIQRVSREIVRRESGTRSLQEATQDVTGTTGSVAVTPTGFRVNIQPKIVELGDLKQATGALQPRDRTRLASDAQIEDIAIRLDPLRLLPSIDASTGAPIIGTDNIIESGNGRVRGIARAAEAYPERYEAYKAELQAQGFDLEGFKRPILVSERVTDMDESARRQFVMDANTPAIARLSAAETAAADQAALSQTVLEAFEGGPVTAPGNRNFVKGFLANLPVAERGAMANERGQLSAEGQRRIENALVAAAYGDKDVIARFTEATDDNARSIMGAMADVAGDWALMRRQFQYGELDPNLDTTTYLTEALRMLSRWRDMAVKDKEQVNEVIKRELAQIDLLSGDIPPETKAFIQGFYANDNFKRTISRERIADHLRNLVKETEAAGKPQLFGDLAPITREELVLNARPEIERFDLEAYADNAEGIAADSGSRIAPTRANLAADAGSAQRGGDDPAPILEVPRRQEPPEGLEAAAARVMAPETPKDIAAQHKVSLDDSEFVELGDIDQLRDEGRLTEDDEAILKASDDLIEDSDAYSEALGAAVRCLL